MDEEEEIDVIKVVEYIDEECWTDAGHSDDDDEITVSEEKILWVRGRSFKISPHEVGIGEKLKELVIESIGTGCRDHHFEKKLGEDLPENEQQQQEQLDSSSRQLQVRLEAKKAKQSTDNTKQQQKQSSDDARIQKKFKTQQKDEIHDTTKEEPVEVEIMSMKDEEVKVHHSMLNQSMSTLSSSHDESETPTEELMVAKEAISSSRDDDQRKSAQEDIKHLKDQLSIVEESKTASNQQEESGTRSGYGNANELAVLKAKLSDSKKEVRAVKETMLLKDEELKAAQEDNKRLQDRLEELMINTTADNNHHHQQESDIIIAAGNHPKEEVVEVLQKAEEHSDSKDEELRAIREAMSWKDKELRAVQEEVKHLKDQLVVEQKPNTTITNQQQSTGVQGNTTKEELELLKAELSDTKKELSDAKEALAKAQEEVKHLKDQLHVVAEQESNAVSTNQQQSDMAVNTAKEELELLKAELEALKAELSDTKEDLRDAKKALAKAAANRTTKVTIISEDQSITDDGRVGNPPQREKEMEQERLEDKRMEGQAVVAKQQKKQYSSRQLQGTAAAPSSRGPPKPSWRREGIALHDLLVGT